MDTRITTRDQNGHSEENVSLGRLEKAQLFPSSRMTVAIMMFFGSIISINLRMNIAFAMVCMIKSNITRGSNANFTRLENGNLTIFNASYMQETRNEGSCDSISQADAEDEMFGEFEWSKSMQGILLGAVFYGNLITQITSGWLSDRYGGKTVLGIGLGFASALNLVIPQVARFNLYLLLILRILQGMFSAVTFPATHSIMSKWAPPVEIGLLMNIAYAGLNVGALILFPLSGFLCKHGFAGGWPSIFYVTGIIGIVYVLGLIFLVYDGYDSHPRISLTEKCYLQAILTNNHHVAGKKLKIPWGDFLKSGPVWALCTAHVSGNWGFYMLILTMPLFMKEVFQFDTQQNGLFSSLPNLCALIVKMGFAPIVDYMRGNDSISLTAQRKLFTGFGMFLPAICLLIITFLSCQQKYIAVGFLIVCHGFTGIGISGGYFYNHIDLSPQHSGTLMGISTAFATLPGILVPLIVGLLTTNGTKEEWEITFFIAIGFYIIGGAVFVLFGSGERQQWSFRNLDHNTQKECHDNPVFALADSPVSIIYHKKITV